MAYKRKNKNEEVIIKKARILNLLKRGYTVSYITDRIAEEFDLEPKGAYVCVCNVRRELYKTNTKMMEEAKDYIINALLGVIEECSSVGDVKSKLQALKQLSETAKVTEQPKTEVNVNFGFAYDDDEEGDN